jgi:hypothetical protein
VYRDFIGVPSVIARWDEAAKEHVTTGEMRGYVNVSRLLLLSAMVTNIRKKRRHRDNGPVRIYGR